MIDLLIHACDVLQVEKDQPRLLVDQDILVQGQRILDIRPANGDAPPIQAQLVIPGEGQLAIPGLINCHAHVPMVLFRGLAEDVTIQAWFNDYIWPLEANLTP